MTDQERMKLLELEQKRLDLITDNYGNIIDDWQDIKEIFNKVKAIDLYYNSIITNKWAV